MSSRAFTGTITGDNGRTFQTILTDLTRVGPVLRARFNDAATSQLRQAWGQELQASRPWADWQGRVLKRAPSVQVRPFGFAVGIGTHSAGLERHFEFGTLHRDEYTTYTRKGRQVRRRTQRQLPPRSQTGWAVYPAAARLAGRAVRLLQQLVVKTLHDALDGGR